jgi:crossover junction endodeoxyribonuclease RuvC
VGVVEGRSGRTAILIAVDVIRTPAGQDLAERLLGIHQAIGGWIDQMHPDVVAVERVFSQHNVRTVMGTAQAAGVAVLAAARRGIPVALHTPSEVKAAVTGSGRAGKQQVAAMVTRILDLPATPKPADAADALALAITHLWRDGTLAVAPGLAGSPTAAQRRWVEAAAEAAQRRPDRLPPAGSVAAGQVAAAQAAAQLAAQLAGGRVATLGSPGASRRRAGGTAR